MIGFRACFALELEALLARRITQVGALLALVVAALAAAAVLRPEAASDTQTINGWRCLAAGMGPGMTVAALLAVVLGSQQVALAAGEGSLRATLCRPVGRTALITAKAGALGLVALGLGLLVIAGAAGAGLFGGYGDVMTQLAGGWYPGPDGAAGDMARRALLLCAGAPLSICTAAWLGLLVSTTCEHAGVAASAALLIAIPVGMAASADSGLASWIFLHPGLEVWEAFAKLARGTATLAWDRAPLQAALWLPLVTLAAAGAAGWIVFTRRDVLS